MNSKTNLVCIVFALIVAVAYSQEGWSPSPTTPAPESCICYEIYQPVCGKNKQVYVNDCFACCPGNGNQGYCQQMAVGPNGTAPATCTCDPSKFTPC